MTLTNAVNKDYYSEAEAARILGITIAKLHQLLDRYVFNVGGRRPSDIQFASSDLLLLAYWNKESSGPSPEAADKVVSIEKYK